MQQITGLADGLGARDHRAQRLRHGRAGIEKIHIDAARPVVAGGEGLRDAAVLARPADAPRLHLADAVRAFLAQQPRQPLVAEPAPGFERVVVVEAPVIRRLRAERDRDRHLRHDGGAAAADQAAVEQEHVATCARSLDRGIHAGAARSDDQDVGFDMHFACLGSLLMPGHPWVRHYSKLVLGDPPRVATGHRIVSTCEIRGLCARQQSSKLCCVLRELNVAGCRDAVR